MNTAKKNLSSIICRLQKVDDFISYVTKNNNNKFLITGEPELIQEVKAEAEKQFHSYLSIYCSDPFFLEIMPQGIDKAHSLTKLLTPASDFLPMP